MKEKCKNAAKNRREKERVEFVELSKLLPLPSSTTSLLDKASIIRLTTSYLRMRNAFPNGLGEQWGSCASLDANSTTKRKQQSKHSQTLQRVDCKTLHLSSTRVKELGSLLLQALDGFVFALHSDGKIMYISETASVYLGLAQIDLTGSNIFDYVHPGDKGELSAMLASRFQRSATTRQQRINSNNNDDDDYCCNNDDNDDDDCDRDDDDDELEFARSFCIRIKCVLPKRNAGLVVDGYKAIHCSGYLRARKVVTTKQQALACNEWFAYTLIAVGHSLLPTASTEVKLNKGVFMFRCELDLRLTFVEDAFASLLQFKSSASMVGKSLYQFVHGSEFLTLSVAHRQMLAKEQAVSSYVRLMRCGGGFVWTQLSLITVTSKSVSKSSAVEQRTQVACIGVALGDQLTSDACLEVESQINNSNNINKFSCSSDLNNKRYLTDDISINNYDTHIDDNHNHQCETRQYLKRFKHTDTPTYCTQHQQHQQTTELIINDDDYNAPIIFSDNNYKQLTTNNIITNSYSTLQQQQQQQQLCSSPSSYSSSTATTALLQCCNQHNHQRRSSNDSSSVFSLTSTASSSSSSVNQRASMNCFEFDSLNLPTTINNNDATSQQQQQLNYECYSNLVGVAQQCLSPIICNYHQDASSLRSLTKQTSSSSSLTNNNSIENINIPSQSTQFEFIDYKNLNTSNNNIDAEDYDTSNNNNNNNFAERQRFESQNYELLTQQPQQVTNSYILIDSCSTQRHCNLTTNSGSLCFT